MGRVTQSLFMLVGLGVALLALASCRQPPQWQTRTEDQGVDTVQEPAEVHFSEPPSLIDQGGGWLRKSVRDGDGRALGALYRNADRSGPAECEQWARDVFSAQLLPARIEYELTELGGTPVLTFVPQDRQSMLSGSASDFSVTLRATFRTKDCARCPLSDEAAISAGSTTVLHRADLFCLTPDAGDPNCAGIAQPFLNWWGRQTRDPADSKAAPRRLGADPYTDVAVHRFLDTREYESVEIWMDLFRFGTDENGEPQIKQRDLAACVLRLFDLPGGSALPAFLPEAPLDEEPAFPIMKDYCVYEEPFNPFFNRDLVTASEFADKGRTGHGLPNTFTDAVDGWSCACDEAGCSSTECERPELSTRELLPRMQLVAQNDYSQYLPVELYCNEHPQICQTLGDPQSATVFNERFGLPKGSTLGRDLLTPRLRPQGAGSSGVPWGGPDGEGDRGVWTKPRFKAGFDSRIVLVLRNEGDTSYTDAAGRSYGTAYCDPADPAPVGRFLYTDKQGVFRSGEYHPFQCLACNFHAQDEDLPAPYRGVHEQYCPSHYGVEQDEGIRLKTDGRLRVPSDARGPAILEVRAVLAARDDDGSERASFAVVRRFPVYIDGLHQGFTLPSRDGEAAVASRSREACWIGATSWVRDADNRMIELKVLPSAIDHYLSRFVAQDVDLLTLPQDRAAARREQLEAVDSWLLGGDVNRWFKRKQGGAARLVTLAGDVQTRMFSLPWLDYRGSSVHFEQYLDESGAPVWVEAEDGVAAGTSCPVMRPMLRDDGLPFEMIRSTGQNRENGRSHLVDVDGKTEIRIDHCQETDKETIAPVSGFQFSDQEERGDAYIWFYVGRDWGWVSPFAQGDGGQEIKKRYDLMSKMSLGVGRYDYETQLPPWGSFLAHWDPQTGIDDLARSVAWTCLEDRDGDGTCGRGDMGTTFLNTAPLVVSDLGQAVDADEAVFLHAPQGFDPVTLEGAEGLLVWHAGSYRTSPLYLSFAMRHDVLRTGRYWHFAGFDSSAPSGARPVWSRLESEAVPIVWDAFGEFAVVDLRERNTAPACERRTVFQDYVLVYPVLGHDGIVLREAQRPYGPWSDIIPVYGNRGNATEFGDKLCEESGIRPLTAYSGYTHVDLWGDSVCQDGVPKTTKVRFNASIWTPYKTLLVESDVTRTAR